MSTWICLLASGVPVRAVRKRCSSAVYCIVGNALAVRPSFCCGIVTHPPVS